MTKIKVKIVQENKNINLLTFTDRFWPESILQNSYRKMFNYRFDMRIFEHRFYTKAKEIDVIIKDDPLSNSVIIKGITFKYKTSIN